MDRRKVLKTFGIGLFAPLLALVPKVEQEDYTFSSVRIGDPNSERYVIWQFGESTVETSFVPASEA